MADKKRPRDELEALRWFRERLRQLGRERPRLKTPYHQERLSAYLTEEQQTCPDNPPATPEDDQ